MTALAQPLIPAAVAVAALIDPDPIFLRSVAVALGVASTFVPAAIYGLCGGMTYSALDHWVARVPLPRGASQRDQPDRSTPVSTALRDSLWQRLLDSLGPGGALKKTVDWSILLNQIPRQLGGGAEGLKSRTLPEWDLVRSRIDNGQPCAIGLMYTNSNIWDQHQILVHGYQNTGPMQGKLYVYDCFAPSQYGQTASSEVTLDFSGTTLVATSPSDSPGAMLVGFFVTDYVPSAPVGMAPSYGEFLNWTDDARTWMVVDGARMPVASPAELTALGGAAGTVRSTGSAIAGTVSRPRDRALFRELSAAPVFLYAGGAPFWIPDPTWLDRLGGWGPVRVVPDGSTAVFQGLPDEGTLLREWSDPHVWLIMDGVRRWVTSPGELDKWGGFASVRIVPDGALAPITVGDPIPRPAVVPDVVGMTLAAAITKLRAAGIVVSERNKEDRDGSSIGLVMAQSPHGGSASTQGATVTIWIGVKPKEKGAPL